MATSTSLIRLATLPLVGTLLFAAPEPAIPSSSERVIEIQEAPFRAFGRSVTARFFVNAPPQRVFETLTDYEHLAEFMPMVDEATLLESREGWAKVRFRVRVLRVFDLVEVDERTMEPWHRISWHAVAGPLRTSDGAWIFTPVGGGTEVTYRTDVDPGIPVPPALTGFLVKQGLPEFLESVRKRVESGGTWRKG